VRSQNGIPFRWTVYTEISWKKPTFKAVYLGVLHGSLSISEAREIRVGEGTIHEDAL